VGHRHFAADRCYVHNFAVTAPQHLRQDRQRAVKAGKEVRSHNIMEILQSLVLYWTDRDYSCVVHKDVNSAETRRRRLNQLFCFFRMTEIVRRDEDVLPPCCTHLQQNPSLHPSLVLLF
jgi:hypothetical protein